MHMTIARFSHASDIYFNYNSLVYSLGISPILNTLGGGGEIRTHGALRHSCFQDKCIRPLCHPSNECCTMRTHAGIYGGCREGDEAGGKARVSDNKHSA